MSATIILADHTGRLGNRLVLYANVIAAAEQYGCRVINLSILAAAHYFQGLHLNPFGAYPKQKFPFDLRWLTRPFRQPIQKWVRNRRGKPPIQNQLVTVLDMENKPTYSLESHEFARLTQNSRFIVLWGYPFRCPNLVQKYEEKIREFFNFRADVAPLATRWLEVSKSQGKKNICIHVRQDDVVNESWRYVPPKLYSAALSNFLEHNIKDEWNVFVCSDGPVPADLFPNAAVQGIPRPLAEDLALMTGCDVVMGFDSTLSIFLAHISGKPFLRIRREDGSLFEDNGLFLGL